MQLIKFKMLNVAIYISWGFGVEQESGWGAPRLRKFGNAWFNRGLDLIQRINSEI